MLNKQNNEDTMQEMIRMAKSLIEQKLAEIYESQLRNRRWTEYILGVFWLDGKFPPKGRVIASPKKVEAYLYNELIHTFTPENMNSPETNQKFISRLT
jgi:hypothetical protein